MFLRGWQPAVYTCTHQPLLTSPCCLPCLCVCVCLTRSVIFDAMEDSKKWQIKEGGLRLLAALAKTAPAQVAVCLPAIVPLISERMVDAREQVRQGQQPGRAMWGVQDLTTSSNSRGAGGGC